ncbi:LPXTG cell wall anchor domain-containing protein [Streptomyces sp. NPDC001255]|uniref:LPXTG cell wall anchor domain-containing protein n=1 Tax=Streptomyces sp. NPDC001255 TaxID=3364550 RepID=UPI0036BE56EB
MTLSSAGHAITTLTTTASGTAIYELPMQHEMMTVRIRQTKAPTGYEGFLSDRTATVTAGESVTIALTHTKKAPAASPPTHAASPSPATRAPSRAEAPPKPAPPGTVPASASPAASSSAPPEATLAQTGARTTSYSAVLAGILLLAGTLALLLARRRARRSQ